MQVADRVRSLPGPWKFCAVVAGLSLLTIVSEVGGLGQGGPALTRIAIALAGFAGALLFALGKRAGWVLVLGWALIQIPFFAPAPGASPTQQSFAALAYHEVSYSVSTGPAARKSGSSLTFGLSSPVADLPSLLAAIGTTGFDEKATGWRVDAYSEVGLGWVGVVFSIMAWRRREHASLIGVRSAIPAR